MEGLDERIPTTVHVYGTVQGWDEYIGRYMGRQGHTIFPESIWGNPYHIGAHGTRSEVLSQYERYLRTKITRDPQLRERLLELTGKTLGCWCAKKDQVLTINDPFICHGQVIAKLYKELFIDGPGL